MLDRHIRYDLPAGWRWQTLREICEVTDRDHRTPVYVESGVPLISPRDFTENGINFSNLKQVIRDEHAAFVKKCKPAKGDILYSRIGTIGEARLLDFDFEFVALHSIALIKPAKEKVYSKFLLYVLQTPDVRAQAKHNIKSVGTPDLGLQRIRNFGVPIPPFTEQKKIVAEIEKQFTRLDVGVAALRRVQANLKRYRAAVLKAACEGRLVPTEAELAKAEGRTYETGKQLLARILADRRKNWHGRGKYKEPAAPDTRNLPPLPEGWTWATMPQLGELSRGKSKHRPRDDAQLYGGSYPFIQTGDVRKSNGTIRDHTQTYSEFGLQQSRLWPEGTLCITIAANIAATGILTFKACFPDSVVGFTQERDSATTRYVEFFIRTAKEKLEQFAPATAQKNINLDVLQKVAVPLPPLAEQIRVVAEIERRLSVIEELEAEVTANLQRAARLRQSVLQRAFSGR